MLSPLAVIYLLTDGVWACIVFIVVMAFGLVLVPPLTRGADLPVRWHVLLGFGLGIGLLCLLLLGLGLVGWMSRTMWIGILVVMGIIGIFKSTSLSSSTCFLNFSILALIGMSSISISCPSFQR